MEPSPAAGGSETTRLVSHLDRGGAGGSLRLKSLFTEPSEPLPEESKPVEMPFHHCHRDPLPPPGLTPERLHARKQLYAACAVCFVFMAGEVVGGYLAHSLAIMTDAAHLLADVGSMMGSLFSLWLSTRPATRTMTFGWHRSEWPLCCTRLGPPTATGLGEQSMHRWRRGLKSPCPWGTPASGQHLCTCWGTSCRALGYWLPPSSSTSSLSTRQPTPSAPSSSPSVPLDPRLPPSEMFFESSWKVPPAMWGSNLCGIRCCRCQESGLPMSCTCGPLRSLTTLPLHTWPSTPLLTLKLSWLKPHPGSTPGLDSPAAPCRSSSTSRRWPSACAARSPHKPEPWPCPHPTARPRLSPGLSASAALITETGPSQVHTPSSLPASTCQFPQPQPQPQPQWARPKCGGEWVGSQGDRCD
nr:PREDICTED: zinc transporter 3 isoform X2 [Macaca fascicularis]